MKNLIFFLAIIAVAASFVYVSFLHVEKQPEYVSIDKANISEGSKIFILLLSTAITLLGLSLLNS